MCVQVNNKAGFFPHSHVKVYDEQFKEPLQDVLFEVIDFMHVCLCICVCIYILFIKDFNFILIILEIALST